MKTQKISKPLPLVQGVTAQALLDAYAKLRAARVALPPSALRKINYDVTWAAMTALAAVQNLGAEVRAELEARTDCDQEKLAAVSDAALAALCAEDAWVRARGRAATDGTVETVNEGLDLRYKMRAQVSAMRQLRSVPSSELAAIKLGRSLATLAADLSRGSEDLGRCWEAIKTRSLITREELDRASAMFAEVAAAVKRLGEGPTPEEAEDRVRAGTVLFSAYGDLQRALVYIRPGEAAILAPGLVRRGRRSAPLAPVAAPDAPAASPATPSSPANAPAPADAPVAPVHPVVA